MYKGNNDTQRMDIVAFNSKAGNHYKNMAWRFGQQSTGIEIISTDIKSITKNMENHHKDMERS